MMAEKLFNSHFIRVFKASHNIQINDFFNSIGCPWFLYLPNHSIEDDDINSVCSQLPGGGIPLSICLIPGHLGNCSQLKCVYICGELEQKMGGKRAANPNYTTDISIGWRRWVKEKYQNDSHLRGFSPPWQSIMAAAEAQPTAGEAEGSSSDIQCDKLNLWRQGGRRWLWIQVHVQIHYLSCHSDSENNLRDDRGDECFGGDDDDRFEILLWRWNNWE